jgi:hypothetical protein
MSDAGKSKVISESIFTNPKIRKLPLICKVLFLDFIIGEKFSGRGVACISTGDMERFIQDDLLSYIENDGKKFKEEFPERAEKCEFIKSRMYPFLDIMEDAGIIKYDRETHVLLIKNYHDYVKWQENMGISSICDSLNKTWVSVHRHHFFDEYFNEIKDRVITLVDAEIIKHTRKQEIFPFKDSDEYKEEWNNLKRCSDLQTKFPKLLEKINEMRCPKKSPTPCKNENLIDSVRGRPVAAR